VVVNWGRMERKRGRMQASIRMVGNLTHQPSD